MFLPLILAAQLALSPEIPVAPNVIRSAPGDQLRPALASDGEHFFAAWENQPYGSDVVGARIRATGEVVDAANGITLQPREVDDRDPAVVWNGSSYAVVFWSGDPSKPYGGKAVEVTTGGEVVVEREVVAPRSLQSIDLAWNGTLYLIAWVETNGNAGVLRLDHDFHAVGEETILGNGAKEIAASDSGSGFLVAWTTGGDTFAARVSNEGAVSTPVVAARTASTIDVAFDAVLADQELVTVGADGRVRDRVQLPGAADGALAWNGFRYVAVWSAGERLVVAELTSSLAFVRTPERLVAEDSVQHSPAIASSETGTMVIWSDGHDVRGALVGQPSTTRLVSSGLTHQDPHDAHWAGGRLFTLWNEDGALRIGAVGAEDVAFAPAASEARFAWNGSSFAVLATRDNKLEVEWLSAEGVPLRPRVMLASGLPFQPFIASDGRDFYAVWLQHPLTITGARIGADGTIGPIEVLPPVIGGPWGRGIAGLVWTGTKYVVLSSEWTGSRFRTTALISTGIASDGTIGDREVVLPYGTPFAGAALTTNGAGAVYVMTLHGETRVRAGAGGAETVVDRSGHGVYGAGWDGHEFLFLLRDWPSTYVVRGGERAEVPAQAAILAAAPSRRAAVLYGRNIERIPGLRLLDIRRAFVRLVTGKRVRAARH
ncbi:MAG TPA: hypothetical protein VF883_17230 [Thermoanaerobaculia bacterium]|jgi:hypothetical protein